MNALVSDQTCAVLISTTRSRVITKNSMLAPQSLESNILAAQFMTSTASLVPGNVLSLPVCNSRSSLQLPLPPLLHSESMADR